MSLPLPCFNWASPGKAEASVNQQSQLCSQAGSVLLVGNPNSSQKYSLQRSRHPAEPPAAPSTASPSGSTASSACPHATGTNWGNVWSWNNDQDLKVTMCMLPTLPAHFARLCMPKNCWSHCLCATGDKPLQRLEQGGAAGTGGQDCGTPRKEPGDVPPAWS